MAVSMVTRSLRSCLFSWYINTQDKYASHEMSEGGKGGREGGEGKKRRERREGKEEREGRRGEEGEENRRWFLTFLRVSSASKRRE